LDILKHERRLQDGLAGRGANVKADKQCRATKFSWPIERSRANFFRLKLDNLAKVFSSLIALRRLPFVGLKHVVGFWIESARDRDTPFLVCGSGARQVGGKFSRSPGEILMKTPASKKSALAHLFHLPTSQLAADLLGRIVS